MALPHRLRRRAAVRLAVLAIVAASLTVASLRRYCVADIDRLECLPDWHVFDGRTCIKCGKTEGET